MLNLFCHNWNGSCVYRPTTEGLVWRSRIFNYQLKFKPRNYDGFFSYSFVPKQPRVSSEELTSDSNHFRDCENTALSSTDSIMTSWKQLNRSSSPFSLTTYSPSIIVVIFNIFSTVQSVRLHCNIRLIYLRTCEET